MQININNVSFSYYKEKEIFRNFHHSFEFNNDCIVIIGHNGAGKTTLLNLICGILRPQSGNISHNIDLAYLPYDNNLYAHLTVLENIEFWYQIYNKEPLDYNNQYYNELLQILELKKLLNVNILTLSTGEEKKLSFLIALLSHAPLIIMDEPFNGIDPISVIQITQVINNSRINGTNFLITSHQLDILEKIATQYVIMKDYNIVEHEQIENDNTDLYERYEKIYGGFS